MVKEFNLESGYYTPQDVENKFGISLKSQVRLRSKKIQLRDKNPLKFIRVGKRILYLASDVEAFLLAKRDENCPPKKNKKS